MNIGRLAKLVAPFLAMTGVGTPLAVGIGAGGGALEAATDDNPDTGVLGGMAKGALPAAAGAMGSRLLGGAGGAAGAVAEPGSGAALYGTQAPGRSLGGRLLDWGKANPEMAMNVAGTGLEAYGAHQEGQAMDRLADIRERELTRDNNREDNMDDILAQITRRLTAPRMG